MTNIALAAQAKTVWEPTAPWIAASNIARFMRTHAIADYHALLARSVHDIRWFWDAALRDLGVEWFTPYAQVLDDSRGLPWARWFADGAINIAHNCVDRHAAGDLASQSALIWENDRGETSTINFAALAREVNRLANQLRAWNVAPGDAVAIILPMCPAVVTALFACFKIGAVAVPIFSGYGPEAIATRLHDANARVLLTCDVATRRGVSIAIKSTIDAALQSAPHVEHVLVSQRDATSTTSLHHPRDLDWATALAAQSEICETARLPAEHPALILYTSGTTGRPKGCVHTHAGALAQIAKEVGYHFDLKPGERFFWLTDIGWMMGPWALIGALFHGASAVLFEGAPDFPAPDALWRVLAQHRVTHAGISPTVIRVLKKSDAALVHQHDLSSLRVLGSTGETWDPESYAWFFEHVGGRRCPIINISGGTEIIGCHLAPLPIHPIKAASLQGPGLAMDVDVWNESGESVREEIGYLVCKQPAPSMTKGFLHDPQRYLDTYFGKWPNVWNHGDWAYVDNDGAWFLFGRADDTIKVAGKRVGPAEIEGLLMQDPRVSEAAVIGAPDDLKGEVIVGFVVVKDCADAPMRRGPDDQAESSTQKDLEETLKNLIATQMGKPMRPHAIHVVAALPKTRSAKIVRGAIRRVYCGESAGDISSIENPHALDAIAALYKKS